MNPKNANKSIRGVTISLQSAEFSLLSITLSYAYVIAEPALAEWFEFF